MRNGAVLALVVLLTLGQVVGSAGVADAQAPLDFSLPAGHFYTQANGQSGAGGTGYSIVNAFEALSPFPTQEMDFFNAFKQFGNVPMLGFPASRVLVFPDFPVQVCQKEVLQFQPGKGFFFLNIFDIMHNRGLDAFLDSVRSIPPQFDTTPDTGLSFDAVVARHEAFLDNDPAIRAVYFSVPNPELQFGLPMSFKDYGNVFVVRAQRAAFQHWRVDVGPNKANTVTIVNGGDIGKEVGLFPAAAVTPVGPPVFNDNIISLLPGANQTVKSPIVAEGYARLFEAAGNWEIRNATEQVIASGTFMAVSGSSSVFASYSFSAPFTVAAAQKGSLTLFSISPANGSRVNQLVVPLTLSP
jgi:hypothetical protein